MKNIVVGLLLSIQFFTSISIRKQLPMNSLTVTAMYKMMPIISLFMGFTITLLIFVNGEFFHSSILLLAVFIIVANIVMTGGLHLDGWIDMSDAFFSYQDQKRRLEILSDSRVGAFGAISLVVMVLLKVTFVYEVLFQDVKQSILYFIVIPFLSRIAMLLYFLTMNNVKESGLAAYFKSQVNQKEVWFWISIYCLLFFIATYYFKNWIFIILYIFMLLFLLLYRKWTNKHFGGMTGDLLGALYEGTELFLWGILLLFI